MEDLKKENQTLKQKLKDMKKRLGIISAPRQRTESVTNLFSSPKMDGEEREELLTVIVLGASGDLAKKKTFPCLFSLYLYDLLPKHFLIYGYARSKMSNEDFRKHASQHFKSGNDAKKKEFLKNLFYINGQYDSKEDFTKLNGAVSKNEGKVGNRIFYLATPPSIFVSVSRQLKATCMSENGFNRVVVEKPFGKDLESFAVLSKDLGELFTEDETYRIDHYLGKEMVQNLMVLRFGNGVFEPLWNRYHISSVTITFKEDIGTEGRGGYFDQYGIIRDVMQNHLFQILTLIAMEPPVSLDAEDVRDEKVKVARACQAIKKEDVVVGQYGADEAGKKQGYLEDKTVPNDSVTPTFATAVVHINNARWKGVPFILKCGKALNERKTEIRIQFHPNPSNLFDKDDLRNELVMRVQPNEAVYMKFNSKVPGLSSDIVQAELDLTYKKRFDARLPDAYERLIYDVIRGDHNLFVRVDELDAAWKVFTPLLHQLEEQKVKPIIYPFGSRGPKEADELANKYGYVRTDYQWNQSKM